MRTRTMVAALAMVLALLLPGLTNLRAQGQQEGIKVHGHWTIDVRQPDGTLVTHREFENALAQFGGLVLKNFLVKSSVPGKWVLVIASTNLGGDTICSASGVPQWQQYACRMNAVVSATSSSFVLSGTVTADYTGAFSNVASGVGECSPAVAGECVQAPITDFTSASLDSPIHVVAGQIIQVTMTISFS